MMIYSNNSSFLTTLLEVQLNATSLGHDAAFNDPQILAHDNNRFRLGIKETLNIHSYKAYKSLN